MTITPSRSDGNSCTETQLSLFNFNDRTLMQRALSWHIFKIDCLGKSKQLIVGAYLLQNIINNGGQLRIAIDYIVKVTGFSKATIVRAINSLIDNNMIILVNGDYFCNINCYIATNKAKKIINDYYELADSVDSLKSHIKENLNYKYNNKSVVSGQGDNTDFIISQERLIKTTIDDCPEIQEAIQIMPIDDMAQELGIKQADLTRAMVHNPKLSLLCLISVYWYNKFGSRKIEKPSAFFAWLRWKATKAQQQEFLIKGFNCFNLREDLNQYREARKLKDIDNKNNDHHKICALTAPDDIRQFVQDSPPPLDARIARQFRLIKSQFLYNLGIDKSKKFHEIKPLGMVNGCLILRASADEILIFSRIYQEFLHKFQSENKQIKSIKFIKTGGKND